MKTAVVFPSHRGAQLRRGVRQQPSQPLPIRRPGLQPYKLRHHRRRPVAAAPDVRWEERRDELRLRLLERVLGRVRARVVVARGRIAAARLLADAWAGDRDHDGMTNDDEPPEETNSPTALGKPYADFFPSE